MKRCTNCGKYPFCGDIQEATAENQCEKWTKREVENNKKLNKVDEGYFEFEDIGPLESEK